VKPKPFFAPSFSPSRGHNSPLFVPPQGSVFQGVDQHYGYATLATQMPSMEDQAELDEAPSVPETSHLDVHMGVNELYRNIMVHFKSNPQCRVSWLNRLLAKCNSAGEFSKAIKAFIQYQYKSVETTPETGTLLIKAACRAGLPEKALEILKDVESIRIFPTLGGIHYLMINFSLKKDTKAVMDTFQVTKSRHLTPTTRTYHILIRECVDNGLIEPALRFANECQEASIVPNRVTYNILMNGCRKVNKAKEILQLRERMNEHKIEINDTTIKFTALAHMMLGDTTSAVNAFHEFPELDAKMEEFCQKFFEVTSEDAEQKKHVVDLFRAVEKKTKLPDSILGMVQQLESNE